MLRRSLALAALTFVFPSRAYADVTQPALVSDGMVLQEKTPVRIWGWAAEGEKVKVDVRGQSATAVTRGGQWSVTLKPLEAGGPFDMTIAGRNTIVLKDIVAGEVWVCSGQSNMEFVLSRAFDAKADIEASADPLLRMFTVGRAVAETPKADVAGNWERATPESRAHFSAVGYYFGRALRAARKVPVGLIHTSWGGTPIEAWTSKSALQDWGMPYFAFGPVGAPTALQKEAYERSMAAWKAAGQPQGNFDDPGLMDSAKSYALPQTDIREWRSTSLPQPWERMGPDMDLDGSIWFRKEVDVPAKWAARDLDLNLGAIDDFDTTYFNGVPVGATGSETRNHWEAPRHYKVPASAVRAGRAVVAVRVWDSGGAGGLTGPAGAMSLSPSGSSDRLSLSGDWRFKPERTRPSMPYPPGVNPNLPSALYNGMIAPLIPYTIKGATWYQGESNAGRAFQYRSLLTTMIRDWRADWRVGDFPFLIVQLAPFMAIKPEPEESDWAALREAQTAAAHDVANVGVAVITDVGDEKDIHPTKKGPVGERLALAARKLAYRENITAFGPAFRSAAIADGKVVVSFDNVGKGLEVRGEKLIGFAVAGTDKKFVNADALIDANRVVVSSPKVASPAYVRFGWANYPVVNLWNKDGLPATPFRTDPP